MSKFPIKSLSLAIMTGVAVTATSAVPAQAVSCKSNRVGSPGEKAILKGSALASARWHWRYKVINKYGVAYSDYHLAVNKKETFSKVGTSWRAFVSARPCRLGGAGFGDLGLDLIDSLVSGRGGRARRGRRAR